MNETVKAALLAERAARRGELAHYTRRIAETTERLRAYETEQQCERRRLADIELHLRDNGVDLAAVDAEAEKARRTSSAQSLVGTLGQGISNLGQNFANGLGQNASNALNARNTFDPTAGLAKALDEA